MDIKACCIKDESGNLEELVVSSGGPWGGNIINLYFQDMLARILSDDFLAKFKAECPTDWLEFMLQFEFVKRSVSLGNDKRMVLTIPMLLADKYKEHSKHQVEIAVKEHPGEGIKYKPGKFILENYGIDKMFESVLQPLVRHLEMLLEKPELEDVTYLMLVGGFADCDLLREKIRRRFGERCRVLTPLDASTSVMQGAVKFGLDPTLIKSRMARKTYGYGVGFKFDESMHPQEKKYVDERGDVWCDDCFKVVVKKGDRLHIGDHKTFQVRPRESKQTELCFRFASTEKGNPLYIDEEGVDAIGEMTLGMPDTTGGLDRMANVIVKFGGTEIEYEAKDVSNNAQNVHMKIDFLCD